MNVSPQQWVVFTLGEQRYALPINSVVRIIQAVEITPLPKAPDIVLGIVDWRGQVVPIVNIRKRFGLHSRELDLNDHFIIAQTVRRILALSVDAVNGVVDRLAQEIVSSKNVFDSIEYISGILRLEDGLILIHDLDQLLSIEEDEVLENALIENR